MDDDWLKQCMPTEALRASFLKSTHWRMLIVGPRWIQARVDRAMPVLRHRIY